MVPLPFAPDDVWGTKPDHDLAGTVGTHRIRAVVEAVDGGYGIVLGPGWRRDCGVAAGETVSVVLVPEGPQTTAPFSTQSKHHGCPVPARSSDGGLALLYAPGGE